MLDRVDRILLAVLDRSYAVATFESVLGAEKVRDDVLGPPYNARRAVVQAGDTEFELLEPAGEGLVADHVERWREGIFAAGFASSTFGDVTERLGAAGVRFSEHANQVFIEPDQTRGMRTVVQASEGRERKGLISGLYEVTNIVGDHEEAATFYSEAFGLDRSRFSPITSQMFGYTGTLTLFDPPTKLDRIELTQITEPRKAMGRFFEKHGSSIYMCFAESPNVLAIQERLEARQARYTPTEDFPGSGLFVHPTALHGMLMGISLTNVAWRWSGRPELAPRRPS